MKLPGTPFAKAAVACSPLGSLTALALVLVTVQAWADCPQELAVYAEEQASGEIAFLGPMRPEDGMEHRFKMTFPENGVALDGVVMRAGEPERPWVIVMHNCPEGDATGAEIDACTVWQGPAYTVDTTGNVQYLQPSGSDHAAGSTLLLPDFSAAMRQSSAWGAKGLSVAPLDGFRLRGCQE